MIHVRLLVGPCPNSEPPEPVSNRGQLALVPALLSTQSAASEKLNGPKICSGGIIPHRNFQLFEVLNGLSNSEFQINRFHSHVEVFLYDVELNLIPLSRI